MPFRILFIASHRPGRAPSQRFRFEQYRRWLSEHGFESELSFLVTEALDRRIYRSGNLLAKAWFAVRSQFIRARDLARAGEFDIVFVHREALMTRGRWFEQLVSRGGSRIVFDFDDAIWMDDDSVISAANRRFRWIKDPSKTAASVRVADVVLAGNEFLADYARSQGQANVRVIPTTIDTDFFRTRRDRSLEREGPICIGWSGSPTTIPHFETICDALLEVKERFGDRVRFKVVGDGEWRSESLGIQGIPWSLDTEVDEVDDIDIGLMPLPDDEWVRGKCGFKALMYMSFEIPAVVSPVGVNPEIVQDGVNGLHANTRQEWVEQISRLVESRELRRRLGQAGRGTVIDRYSVESQRDRYLEVLESLVESSNSR